MANTIQDFKTALRGGGARANLFQVDLSLPSNIVKDQAYEDGKFSILCKSAALPASNIASIEVPFRGRTFKVAGDRTFDNWTVTVINDTDFGIRNTMENWMQAIGQYGDGSGFTDPENYMAIANVKQFSRALSNVGFNTPFGSGNENHNVVANYKFYDIFPTNISAIDLSYDSSDTIEEFTVDFQVQYWTPLGATNETSSIG
jgi:hypothetical protein